MLYPRFKSVVLKSIIVRVFKCCCITVFIIQAAGQACRPPVHASNEPDIGYSEAAVNINYG